MTDYTPTTEEVRDRYNTFDNPKTEAEFDRWIAEVKAKAVAEWLAERMAAFEKATLEDYEQGETE